MRQTKPSSTNRASYPGPVSRAIAAVYDLVTGEMERQILGLYRRRLLAAAHGKVLDLGAGTGAYLPYLPWDQVSEFVLIDPSPGMLERARRKATELRVAVQTIEGRAEPLPIEDGSVDTVVFTCALCTIPDSRAALWEAHRVLCPNGSLLVLEHVRAKESGLAAWQDRITPLWQRVGGCHPNRDTRATTEAAGFAFELVEEFRERRIPIPIVQPQLIGTARRPERAF